MDKYQTLEKYNVLEKYSLEFIEIFNHNEIASKVFGNHDILLIIFSFFKSGWGYIYHKLEIKKRIFWEDIFKKKVEVFWVTNTMLNPYKRDGVYKKIADSSYYVGPVIKCCNHRYLNK